MKKILGTILTLVLSVGIACAQNLTSEQVKSDVEKVLMKTYYNELTGFDVEVKVVNTPFSELIIPDGRIYYEVVSPKDKFLPILYNSQPECVNCLL